MNYQLLLASGLTFCSTLVGGIFALKFQKKLHLIMGFTAWVILWVVSFDLLPEVMKLSQENSFDFSHAMLFFVWGFLVFHILEKVILIHHSHEWDYAHHHHPHVGIASSMALIGHSFLDGMAIGVWFQFSQAVGIILALAVIAHDFTDGMNTVSLMLHHKNTEKKAKIFLLADALAPIWWIFFTLFIAFSQAFLIASLSFFAWFLLYIAASDVLPEAHREKSSFVTIALTLLGVTCMYAITQIL